MKILCVEDGSVDLDELEESGLQDGKILVYRQGARPPYILEFKDNKEGISKDKWEELKSYVKKGKDTSYLVKAILDKMEQLEGERK